MIWADKENNALVITAPPKIMKAINSIIDKLDILRAQVAIEAIIADVDTDKSAQLGVNWAVFSKGGTVPVASFVAPVSGTSIVDLAAAAQNPTTITTTLLQGATFGVGRIATGTGVSFAAMLRALRSDSTTNIISTPSTITLDNQEAEMKSAEEVPFISGQYTSTSAATTSGVVTPFTTVNREEVGTILKVTPMISAEGRDVQLKISIEDSSLGNKPPGLTDFTTNKRSVTTTVRIEDGGIIVLGGLTKDQTTRNETRVPFLGTVPLLGLLFKSRDADHTKNNLMIFIRPHVIRSSSELAEDTEGKYHFVEREEHRTVPRYDLVPMLPFEKDPHLPPFPTQAPKKAGDLAPASVEEKEKAAQESRREDRATTTPQGTAPAPQTTAPTPQAAPAPQATPSVVPPLPEPPPR
jgi:general secretion pathway protein D